MRLLLDTAVLVFAIEAPEKLSKRAGSVLENQENLADISAISLAEMAIKSATGKLKIFPERLKQAIQDMGLRVLPFTAAHAFELFSLPLHHRDPFDRQLIAQALAERIPIVTPDAEFRRYKGLEVIW